MQEGCDIVDRDAFSKARAELGTSFAKILSYYREDGAKVIADIERAARDRSAACMVRPAHTLKGDSLMVGADVLGETAEIIEKAARSAVEMHDFPVDVLPKVRQLRQLFAETLAFFDREMPEAPKPVISAAPRRGGFGRKVA